MRKATNLTAMPWTVRGTIANMLRLILALAWALSWGTCRWIKYAFWGQAKARTLAFPWNRRQSPVAMICACGWAGPLRWAIHTYARGGGYAFDDTGEAVDVCARCGQAESMTPVIRHKRGWTS